MCHCLRRLAGGPRCPDQQTAGSTDSNVFGLLPMVDQCVGMRFCELFQRLTMRAMVLWLPAAVAVLRQDLRAPDGSSVSNNPQLERFRKKSLQMFKIARSNGVNSVIPKDWSEWIPPVVTKTVDKVRASVRSLPKITRIQGMP